jgi:hypothetical protein
MYEVCSGQRLPTCGQEWHDIRNGNLCSLLPGTMPCLYGIIREMMHQDPERRPSATNLLSRDALRPTNLILILYTAVALHTIMWKYQSRT